MMWWLLAWFGCGGQAQWPQEVKDPTAQCAANALSDEEMVLKLTSDKWPRMSLIYAPSTPGPHDVVVNFHEFRSEPRRQAAYSGWLEYARANNIILIAPDGRYSTWNAGNGCCGKSAKKNINDGAWLDQVVAKVNATGCTSGRVVATGVGNGAMAASRWACESEVVDGLITVGGGLQIPSCAGKPLPWLHYHGADDDYYPFDGKPGILPMSHAIEQFAKRNQATLSDDVFNDQDLSCAQYKGKAPMQICKVAGMKDRWPGAEGSVLSSTHPLSTATAGGYRWVVENLHE